MSYYIYHVYSDVWYSYCKRFSLGVWNEQSHVGNVRVLICERIDGTTL